ncbi:MAG: phosphatase PAP2 family protein, partial [Myxococcales bacterium]|nr:phosphatase PAP2 family protein [Myxococcales bacterium]
GLLTAGGALAYAFSETTFKDTLGPDVCRWCDDNALDRGVRNGLRWDDLALANTLSNAVGFGLAPAFALGVLSLSGGQDRRRDALDAASDGLIVLETGVAVGLVSQVFKFGFGRQRPFAHADHPGQAALAPDENLSFFSGHTSLSVGVAVTASEIARYRGYKTRPYLLYGGLTLAATTAYLRIAADKHYLTDVVTGAAFGAGLGWLVPRLHDWTEQVGVSMVPIPGGLAVVGEF